MFDWIRYPAQPCPKCGAEVKGWQSKDGPCEGQTLHPWEVDHFYAICNGCNAWVAGRVDADVQQIVRRCDVTFTAEEIRRR